MIDEAVLSTSLDGLDRTIRFTHRSGGTSGEWVSLNSTLLDLKPTVTAPILANTGMRRFRSVACINVRGQHATSSHYGCQHNISNTATSGTAAQPVPIIHLGRKPWLAKFTGDPLDYQELSSVQERPWQIGGADWGCRLEAQVERSGPLPQSKDAMLRQTLWGGLRQSLKDLSVFQFQQASTVDELRVKLRRIERDHLNTLPTKANVRQAQAKSWKN
ncbi:hypothetical protein ElyMa_006468300 [Elysia marginata]|uniref:Uncharacterized protein n=1 Tax=Elysia marginata TaxID=1093978 RepID=A0AAV4HZI8_9GAST|nr:hypothetical protein ElyMa_006468300 [Elysia marginata]